MTTKNFDLQELKEVRWCDSETLTFVDLVYMAKGRWSTDYKLVFQENATGDLYMTSYAEPATECQDNDPFDYNYADKTVTCERCYRKNVVTTVYEPLP